MSRAERISKCISAVSMQITDRANHTVRSRYYIARKFRHRIEAYIRAKANKHEDSFVPNSFNHRIASFVSLEYSTLYIHLQNIYAFRVTHKVHNISFYLYYSMNNRDRKVAMHFMRYSASWIRIFQFRHRHTVCPKSAWNPNTSPFGDPQEESDKRQDDDKLVIFVMYL